MRCARAGLRLLSRCDSIESMRLVDMGPLLARQFVLKVKSRRSRTRSGACSPAVSRLTVLLARTDLGLIPFLA